MARTDLPITPMPKAGLSLAGALPTAAAVDGHAFGHSAKRLVRIRNSSGSPKTVTAVIPGEVEGQPLADRPYVIPATTGDVLIPPFGDIYAQDDGKVYLDYPADPSGLTVAVYEMP
ncbi:hypothetical protein [Nonomuraea wenchangensis]|uniref:Uncharacterized protein n=1 Tax=Nonomuraea wenchangensis TaxID=568860 RepID=A0A1I0LU72_9ACTN|nr:hypothetical protein [Nonomuraea wenchangensis]SEU46602.1 hypothetical protein SAMN05421811_12791 [Nonomuraea wenchangensis]